MGYKTRLKYDLKLETLCRSERHVGVSRASLVLFKGTSRQTDILLAIVIHPIILEYQLDFSSCLLIDAFFLRDSNTRFCGASYLSVGMMLQYHMLTVCTRPQQKQGFYIDILSRLSEFQNCAHKNVDCQEILVVPILLGSPCSWFIHSYHPAVIWSQSKWDWVLIQGLFGSVCWIMFYLNFLIFLANFTCVLGVESGRNCRISVCAAQQVVTKLLPKYSLQIYAKLLQYSFQISFCACEINRVLQLISIESGSL